MSASPGGANDVKDSGEAENRVRAVWRSLLHSPGELDHSDWILASGVSLSALIVYAVTLAPTVTGEDSGELIAASYLTGVAHPPGYPLWCLLTKPFFLVPIGDMAWRANFASAFFGSATVGAMFLLARRWGVNRLGAWTAALVLGFSQRFWSQSVITEVYPLNALLLVVVLHLAETVRGGPAVDEPQRKRRAALLALGLVFGLSLANHYMLMLLVAPGIALMLVPRWGWLKAEWCCLLGAAALMFAGLLVYLYLPLAASRNTYINWGDPDSWGTFWGHVLRRSYRSLEFSQEVTSGTKLLFMGHAAYELWKQFTPYLFFLLPLGIRALWQKDRWRFGGSVAVFLLNTVVLIWILRFTFERENQQRVEVYYLPAYAMAAVWIGLGVSKVVDFTVVWFESRLQGPRVPPQMAKLPPLSCVVLGLAAPLLPFLRHLDENNRREFWIARDYAESILGTVEKNAVIFPSADFTTFPLIYLIGVEKMRQDVLLADKYGTLSEETHDLFRRLAPGVRQTTRNDIIRAIVEKSGRPVYFTARSSFPSMPGHKLLPWGLLYKACPAEMPPSAPQAPWAGVVIRNPDCSAESMDPMERGLASAYFRMRAEFLLSRGEARRGTALLERAAKIVFDDHKGLNNLGSVAAEYGQKRTAARLYRRALDVWPEYVTPYVNLTAMALDESKPGEADAYLREAELVAPDDPRLAPLRKRLRDARGAAHSLESLLKAAKETPGDPVAHNNLGTALAEAGRLDEAAKHWLQAVKLDPSYAFPHKNLAVYYEKEARDPARAEHHRQEYFRLGGDARVPVPTPLMPPVPSVPSPPKARPSPRHRTPRW